jgi:predicted dehydrogenase
MRSRLRVGVIGLGRRWRLRYRPALQALGKQVEVRALCDPVPKRAHCEAKQWGCAAAAPSELLERGDIEAILLLDPGWYRLWPVEVACRLGKPVFCAGSLAADEERADALLQQVQESRVPVIMEMLPRFASVTDRLCERLQTTLGPPRWVTCTLLEGDDAPKAPNEVNPIRELLGSAGIPLLDWCAKLLDGEPRSVLATKVGRASFGTVFLELDQDRAIAVSRQRSPGSGRSLRLVVGAEQGTAWIDWPRTIGWHGPGGKHTFTPGRQPPLAQIVLEHFVQVREGATPPEPNLAAAYRALRWLRAAVQSQAEGRRIPMTA